MTKLPCKPRIEARAILAYFNPDGDSSIQFIFRKNGVLTHGVERIFLSCGHAECYKVHLSALIIALPQALVNEMIDGGIKEFEIVAPPGVKSEGKDITGQPITFAPMRH